MKVHKLPKLRIGHLEARLPIIQGGMGVRISLSGLASAVANEGAIGVISAAAIGIAECNSRTDFSQANKRSLVSEIRRARKRTPGVIGVNIMVALSDYDELVSVAYKEKVDIIFAGAGLPLKIPKTLTHEELVKGHTRFVPIVSSARAAGLIFKYWHRHYKHVPDGIVVEGPLAGGHLGFNESQINDPNYALERIIPEVLLVARSYEELYEKEIPVIAAGGIYTGADIYEYLNAGVQGVQMGTRFVATHECDASNEFKQAYVKCKKEDIAIIKSPVGMPGRAIKNPFLRRIENGMKQKFTCPFKCLKTCNFKEAYYCIAQALSNAQRGILDGGFAFAGANAFRVNKIVSVHKLIQTLIEEFNARAEKAMGCTQILAQCVG